MAFKTRTRVMAFKEETSEGSLVFPAASDFTSIREGSTLTPAVNSTQSDTLKSSIAASRSFVTSEAPTGSVPKYFETSGIEGQAPDWAVLLKSCLGGLNVRSTERLTAAGSTAGDENTNASIKVASGEEAEYILGEGMLIKDSANGFAVRHVIAKADGDLTSNFNFASAPSSGVGLGKGVTFFGADNQPTFSAHAYQAKTDSAMHIAAAGCRTTAVNFEMPVNDLASMGFEIAGNSFFLNPIKIDATNNLIDFDDGSAQQASISQKVYKTPMHLADELASKMNDQSSDAISVKWDNTSGKFVISSDGGSFSLLTNTGAGSATSIYSTIGFDTDADNTGSTSYSSDNERNYAPSVTPSLDDTEPTVVRDQMLLLGTKEDYVCFGGQSFTVSIGTPKTDVPNWCAESGIDESVINSRETTVSATLKFKKHDVERIYNLLQNKTIQAQFVVGKKIAGNWVPGTVRSIYMPELSVTTNTIDDQDGYIVENMEATAVAGNTLDDVYITLL